MYLSKYANTEQQSVVRCTEPHSTESVITVLFIHFPTVTVL